MPAETSLALAVSCAGRASLRRAPLVWMWSVVVACAPPPAAPGDDGRPTTTPTAPLPVDESDEGDGDGDDVVPGDGGDADDDAAAPPEVPVLPDDGGPDPVDPTALVPWHPGPAGTPVAVLQQQLDTSGDVCSEDDWLRKYFRYRRRLRGDGTPAFPGFVIHSDGPGGGMLATLRRPGETCTSDWWAADASCPDLGVPDARGLYEWGDATIWLGWYMATLATEYAVFRDLGLPVAETTADLREALHALNRLDEVAETHFGRPPARDGFFQRDDVGPRAIFADDGQGLRFPIEDGAGYACIKAQGACGALGDIDDGFFESQDQVIGLLLGWAMIARLVPDDVVVDGMALRQEARAQTHRVVNHLRDRGWKIVAPDGSSPPNKWGGDASGMAFAIADAANRITGNAFGVDDYSNFDSNTVGASAWAGLDGGWLAQSGINKGMVLKLTAITDKWSDERVARRALDEATPVWPMIRALLLDAPLDPLVADSLVDSLLSSAPCDGPCTRSAGCNETPGWQGESRWANPGARTGDPNGQYGEYNGTDYMLLHNLTYLLRRGQYRMEIPPPAASCPVDGVPRIEQLRRNPTPGSSMSLQDPCIGTSLAERYCGRDFASWLDDSMQGRVRILVGDQRLVCTAAACRLQDNDGGAAVDGSDGPDLFLGTDGDDFFEANGGADCLLGFGGNDRLEGGRGVDELHGGPGNDELCGESCHLTDLNGEPDALFGDEDDDVLRGGPGGDELHGGAGNDEADGDSGTDFVFGGAGNDLLHGGGDDDIVVGGPDDDTGYGDDGNDRLLGQGGRDRLDGGWGDDNLVGADGDDFLKGSDGNDTLWGEDGDDRVCGNCGDDYVNGGWSSLDACQASGSFCVTGQDDRDEGCGVEVAASECRDADFDAW
jgi:hypothetical protein